MNPTKKRLWLNLALLLVIAGLVAFIATREEDTSELHATLYDPAIGDEAREVIIHAEGRPDVVLKQEDSSWKVVKPSQFIADTAKVHHLFTLLSEDAESHYALEDKDWARYGLDKNRLSVSFNGVTIIFGNYNEVAHKRYLRKGDTLYLVEETVAGMLKRGEDAFRPQARPVLTPLQGSQ